MANFKDIPVISQTAALYVQDPITEVWHLLAGMTNLSGPQSTVEEIDATNLSDLARRFLPGLPSHGSLSGTAQTMFGSPAQWMLSKSMENNPPDTFKFKLRVPDDGQKNGEVWGYGEGFVTAFPVEGAVGAVVTSSISIKLTGHWNWERPTDHGRKMVWSRSTMYGSGAMNGRVTGTVRVTLDGDTFIGNVGDPVQGMTFANLPTGLTVEAIVAKATVAVLTFTGAATAFAPDTLDVVTVTFGDSAFTGGNAADVLSNERLITIAW